MLTSAESPLARAALAIARAGLGPPLQVVAGPGRLTLDMRRCAVIVDAGAWVLGQLAWRASIDARWGVLGGDEGFQWVAPHEWSPKDGDTLVVPALGLHHAGGVAGLIEVVSRLLDPDGGCPWDLEQTHHTLKKHLLEESYEVLDAIDAGDLERLREELGDVLLQPLMHAEIDRRAGEYAGIEQVAHEAAEKLVRRHPHVFGDTEVADAQEVLRNWDRIKQHEKGGEPRSILEGVPRGMASLLRAYEISKRAARVGFEWPDVEAVFDKLHEEERELRAELVSRDAARIEAEVGDLLFTVVNLARWGKVEPEEALRSMLNRFTDRFQRMEREAEKPLRDLSAQEWDDLWTRAKADSA